MRPKLILIVDDDNEDVEVFIEVVHEIDSDIKCISAHDGYEALKVLSELTVFPDYIFLDMNMPRLNGKQCLAKIKENKLLMDICIVIYTTSKLKTDIEETRTLGAGYFLTKPTKFEDIKKAISYIITQSCDKAPVNLENFLVDHNSN